jgi:putative MFS transporter
MPVLFISKGFTFAHSLQYTAIITAAAIPGKLLNGYLAERIGRKSVFILFMGLAGIACLFFGLAVTPGAMIFYASVMSFCGTGAFPALKMSYAEQYPSSLRTTGAATVETLGRFFGGVVGSYVMPFLLNDKAAASGFYIVAAVAFAAIAAEAIFSPETKGYTLEQLEKGALDQGGR